MEYKKISTGKCDSLVNKFSKVYITADRWYQSPNESKNLGRIAYQGCLNNGPSKTKCEVCLNIQLQRVKT